MIANPHVYVIRRARRKFKRLRHKTKGARSNSVNNERARRGIGYQALSQAGAASGINPAMHCRALFPSITRINVYCGQEFLLLHVYSPPFRI
jgi:hypothetical protein